MLQAVQAVKGIYVTLALCFVGVTSSQIVASVPFHGQMTDGGLAVKPLQPGAYHYSLEHKYVAAWSG